MRKKKCQCCHELYQPDSRTYSQQKTCSKPQCRAWRRHKAVKSWKQKNPYCAEWNPAKQKKWRQENKGYWKKWRAKHPGYVAKNRKAQRRRNAKCRGLIAKGNEIEAICTEKIEQIRYLRLIAKGNELGWVIQKQIDGICRYLRWQLLIAKGNDIDIVRMI